MLDDLPLDGEQFQLVVIVLALVSAAVAAPMMFSGGNPAATNGTEVHTGTYQTPEPVQTARADTTEAPDRLNALPASHTETGATGVEAPPQVSASAGSQTMDVTATTVDGEPALVLSDSRVHEGRWVSVPTDWFNQSVGGVPRAAYIEHESGESYTTPTHVRGNDMAFYVEEFSTNTVTFSGEVVLSGNPAADGTSYQYSLPEVDSANNFSVEVTGSSNREWDNVSATGVSPSTTVDPALAGNLEPTGPAAGEPRLTVTGHEDSWNYHSMRDVTQDTFPSIFGDYGDSPIHSGMQFTPDEGGTIRELKFADKQSYSNLDGDTNIVVDIYIIQEPVDNTIKEGTKIRDDYVPGSEGYDNIPVDTNYRLEAGKTYTLEVYTEQVSNDGEADELAVYGDDDETSSNMYSDGSSLDSLRPSWRVYVDQTPNVTVTDTSSGTTADIGQLGEGETQTTSIDLSRSSTLDFANSGAGGTIDYTLAAQEGTQTVDPCVEVNGNQTCYTGSVPNGTTKSLSTEIAWLKSETNRVNVTVGDGTLSGDAPTPQVELAYTHEATDRVAVDSTESEWLEKYNVTKQYASDRSNATLTIPHQRSVVRIQSVETRTNGGSWQTVTASGYSLDGTELSVNIGSVTAGDTVEVRTTGTTAKAINGRITVTEPTTSGQRLNTAITVDSWATDAYIEVPQTGAYHRIHDIKNASWAAEENVRVTATDQRLRLPNVTAGDTARVSTIPIEADPETDVVVSVVDRNTSHPEFAVEPGKTPGDAVNYTFIEATDGVKYSLYSTTSNVSRDSGTASSPLTLTDDDSIEQLMFLAENTTASSSGGDGGGGVLDRVSTQDPTGNVVPLVGVALAIGALLVIAQRDEEVTNAGNDAAQGIESAAQSVPVVGPAVGGALGGLTRGGAQLVRTVLGNQTVAVAVATAIGLAAIQAEIIVLPAGSLVIVATAAVSAISFVALREFGEFSMERWALIVVSSTVVSLQVLSDESLLTAIVKSQAWPILAVGGLYLAYQFVQSLRAEGTQNIVIETDGGSE